MSDVADFWAAREVVGVFSDYDEERDRETVRLARKVFAVEDAVSVQGGKVDGVCVCCGVAFVGPVGKKYCSVNCYQHTKFGKMLRERVACGFCGEMFRPTTGIQKFCGNPCRLRALAGRSRRMVCRFCGEKFVKSDGLRFFCSVDCRDSQHKLNLRKAVVKRGGR